MRIAKNPVSNYLLTALGVFVSITFTYSRDLERLTILGPNYPRVFYFRASERACSTKTYPTYESWERNFSGLMGIIGKCLEEECKGREPRNPEFFSRFKRQHPNQAVLLHFNGNARDPIYQAAHYFPGHWIYRKATVITRDVAATPGESVISVSDAGNFRVNAGRYRTHNDDIALFGIKDRLHDWYHCEYVQLLAVDQQKNTITVKRGCYGTKPLEFRARESRAAAHQTEGPWGPNNNLMWYYNFCTHCPKDSRGRTCSDILVDDLAGWFSTGGTLEAFDGVEFDVLHNMTHGDTDGDGEPDRGTVDGINNYGIGVVEFGRKLRTRMGEDFIIQADGALGRGGIRSQRNWEIFNGIESEGWPNLREWDMEDWSGGLNRHFFWQQNARRPVFNYINHKWVEPIPDRPGHHKQARVPFSRHRLAFAAAQFFDAMICYSSKPRPPVSTGYTYWQRDLKIPPEAVLRFSVGMGPLSPTRSDGVWFRVYAAPTATTETEAYRKIFEKSTKQHKWLACSVPLNEYAGKSIRLKFVADCGPNDNATTDHASWGNVRVVSPGQKLPLVSDNLPDRGMCIRNKSEKPLDPQTGAKLEYIEQQNIGGASLPVYSIHPPYSRARGFEKFPIWDEFVRGQDNILGWLGKPEGPAVHIAAEKPDLMKGTGRGTALAEKIIGQVTAEAKNNTVLVRSATRDSREIKFSIRDIPAKSQDLFVSLRMRGAPMAGHPREMARFARMTASGGMTDLMSGDLDTTGMRVRGREEEPIDRATGARANKANVKINGTALPAVSVHPPYREKTGYTFWARETEVPPNNEVRFCIGMGPKSPERSDGVWFRVYAANVAGNGLSPYTKIFEESSKAHEWLNRAVSLARYGGKRIRLKFVADAGPKDNSTTDHAHWGAVGLTTAGLAGSKLTEPKEYMTWVNDKSFTSTFYYRNIKSPKIDLSFAVQSSEPVELESVTAHAHPDAMYRVFENGLVLANPGYKPYTFSLNAIAPGRKYRRMKATRLQDKSMNNGKPVGSKVTLGERDALFLIRTEQARSNR